MTMFVSRHARHRHEIWSGLQDPISQNGTLKMVTRIPYFVAEFEPKRLTELQRRTAAHYFGMADYGLSTMLLPHSVDLGPDVASGQAPGPMPYKFEAAATAMPRAHDDVIIGPMGPEATTGYDPQFFLGAFDTDRDINYQSLGCRTDAEKKAAKAECERVLRESPDYGRSIIAIDAATIPKPFPAWEKMKGDSEATVKQMLDTCEAAGFRYGELVAYEKATQNRPNMLAALEARYAEERERDERHAAARAQLEVQVG